MKSLMILSCLLMLSAVCKADEAPAAITVGTPAPDISLTGIDGKKFKLSEVTGSGKHVALMFSRAHW